MTLTNPQAADRQVQNNSVFSLFSLALSHEIVVLWFQAEIAGKKNTMNQVTANQDKLTQAKAAMRAALRAAITGSVAGNAYSA